jgi:hypothetical protein
MLIDLSWALDFFEAVNVPVFPALTAKLSRIHALHPYMAYGFTLHIELENQS